MNQSWLWQGLQSQPEGGEGQRRACGIPKGDGLKSDPFISYHIMSPQGKEQKSMSANVLPSPVLLNLFLLIFLPFFFLGKER